MTSGMCNGVNIVELEQLNTFALIHALAAFVRPSLLAFYEAWKEHAMNTSTNPRWWQVHDPKARTLLYWIKSCVPESSHKHMHSDNAAEWDVTILFNIIERCKVWNAGDPTLIRAVGQCRKDRNDLIAHKESFNILKTELLQGLDHAAALVRKLIEVSGAKVQLQAKLQTHLQQLTTYRTECERDNLTLRTIQQDKISQDHIQFYITEFCETHNVAKSMSTMMKNCIKEINTQQVELLNLLMSSLRPDSIFFARFEQRSGDDQPGVVAKFSVVDDFSVERVDTQSLQEPISLSLSDLQTYGLPMTKFQFKDSFNAYSSRLMFSDRPEFDSMRRTFMQSLQWSQAREDGDGFAVPEIHFDMCGSGDKLGQGVGVKKSTSKAIRRRMHEILTATSIDSRSAHEWYLGFLAATSSYLDGRLPARHSSEYILPSYGPSSASDDFVYRLLPYFMSNSSISFREMNRQRQDSRLQPFCGSIWTAYELLQFISGKDWDYFRPMFELCYPETMLSTQYELLGHPRIILMIRQRDGTYARKNWPVIAIPPRFLLFKGSPYGITEQTISTMVGLADKSLRELIHPLLLETQEQEKPIDMFHFFLDRCFLQERVMQSFVNYFILQSRTDFAVVLPSKQAFAQVRAQYSAVPGLVPMSQSFDSVLPLEFKQADESITLAITYLDEKGRLHKKVKLSSTEEKSDHPASHQPSFAHLVDANGGKNLNTVIFLFVEAVDMDARSNRILDIVVPNRLKNTTQTRNGLEVPIILDSFNLPSLEEFLSSDDYNYFKQSNAKFIQELDIINPQTRYNAIPDLITDEVTLMSRSIMNKIHVVKGPSVFELSDIIAVLDTETVRSAFGDAGSRCPIVPFAIVMENIHEVQAEVNKERADRQTYAMNVILRFVGALLKYGVDKVFHWSRVTQCLQIAREACESSDDDDSMEEVDH